MRCLDMLKAKYSGQPYDQTAYATTLAAAVKDTVRKQAECGIDIVTDGEFSKPGFFTYIQERLEGFERRPDQKMKLFQQEVAAFPEYYAEYFKQAMMGGAIVGLAPVVCIAPVKYRGEKLVQIDIDNVKKAAAAAGVPNHHVFLPATAPSGVGINEYYKSDEEYFHALAAELGKEYRAIADAGILVQIDDPFLPDIFFEPDLDRAQMRRRAEIYVEATNTALKGIPPDKVRFHTCYGINEGPRLYEAALADIIDYVLKINAGSYSFEAANPRHEHEYHLFERVKLADGKVICPGMITHASNIVEHPELIAERIVRFAKLVGRENVIAAADCGFSSQALYRTEVHPTVVWEKFKALTSGRGPCDQDALEITPSFASAAKQSSSAAQSGLLRRFAPRNDAGCSPPPLPTPPTTSQTSTAASRSASSSARRRAAPMICSPASWRATSAAHIPGTPSIIVQNQPTAGGLLMVNQLYALGPNDGTAIGVPLNGIPAAPLLQPAAAHFDAAKLIWLGSTHSEPYVAYVWHTAPVQNLAEVMSKQLVVGATTPGTTMNDFPQLTNAILGTKFKIVPGYASTPQMNEALERGEVEGVAGFGWFALNAQVPQWVTEKKITIIAQFGATRHRLLPDVPLMLDLAKSDADRQALMLLFGRTEYGRPYFLPPDVPAERVQALRRAFDATMKDEGFIADATKIGFEVDPLSGEQVQASVAALAHTPPDVVARVRAALNQP